MTQQINLLVVGAKQARSAASARVLAPVLALVLLLALGGYAYLRYQITGLRAELAQVERAVKEEQQKQTEAAQTLAARVQDPALAAEIERMDRQLSALRASLAVLKSGVIGDVDGYSRHMLGFARQALEGLWLTGFSIAGTEISIEGRALRADLVPMYFKRLAQEPAFAGRDFSALSIGRPQVVAQKDGVGPGGYLAFRLVAGEAGAAPRGVELAAAKQP